MFIACDESGFTGANLLSNDQRFFSYASCTLNDHDAWELINQLRNKHQIQMPELKSQKLLKTKAGRSFIVEALSKIEGKYAVNVHDKLLALCGWAFEYIYEPVLQGENFKVLAKHDFHKFIAMFLWNWVNVDDSNAKTFITEFQDYMRNLQAWRAPLLFENTNLNIEDEDPFDLILLFSNGYKHLIVPDNEEISDILPDQGKWLLDLSVTSLWSHMSHWSTHGEKLNILCDSSKPLYSFKDSIPTTPSELVSLREAHYFPEKIVGWELENPVKFGDSRNHPSIQLADLVAGTAIQVFNRNINLTPDTRPLFEAIERHGLTEHSILPNLDIIKLDTKHGMACYRMMFFLANLAINKTWPLPNLEDIFILAEQ